MGGNPVKQYIGIDVGGTKIALVRGTAEGKILQKVRFENNTDCKTALDRIVAEAKKLGPAEAIGISCGGPLDSRRGLIQSPPNLPGWDNIPITDLLQKATGIPTYLQNDANACALAEWKFGAGRGTENMIFLTFGTGMGAGLILNDSLYEGTNGNAGEAGHIPLAKRGPVGYGKVGSFEGFCSGGGLQRMAQARAKEAFAQNKIPSFCESPDQIDQITAKILAERALKGHKDALEIFRLCGTMLGRGLSILIDLLNPEAIVLGSIYTRVPTLLIPTMEEELNNQCLSPSRAVCRILPAALGESLGDVAALTVAINGERSNR